MNCQESKNENWVHDFIAEELRSCQAVSTEEASRRVMSAIQGRTFVLPAPELSWTRCCLYGMAACCTIFLGYALGCLYLSGFEPGSTYHLSVMPDMMSVTFGGGFMF